jgi:hypothetical protein
VAKTEGRNNTQMNILKLVPAIKNYMIGMKIACVSRESASLLS